MVSDSLRYFCNSRRFELPPNRASDGVVSSANVWQRASAEEVVLLCCCRTHMDAETSERLERTLELTIRWEHLLQLAQWNSVLPLLFRTLNSTFSDMVPSEILQRLRLSFEASHRHNLLLSHELLRLLIAFDDRGILAVPFKGPVLATETYGNLAFRQFDDLDILLPRGHAQEQITVMRSLGYRPTYAVPAPTVDRLRQGLSFVHEHNRVAVDLHWGIELHWSFNPHVTSAQQYRQLWKRLHSVSLVGVDVKSLAPEDSLLLLSVHGAKHKWRSLRWICDVAEIVRAHQNLDWDAVIATSITLHGRRMALLALLLAHEALGAPVPDRVLRRIDGDRTVRMLASQVSAEIFLARHFESEDSIIFEPFHLRVMDTFGERMRYCLQIALTPTVDDLTFMRLPARLFWIYYGARPLRLALKYRGRIRRLRGMRQKGAYPGSVEM